MIPITLTLNYIVTQKPTLIYFLIYFYQNVLPSFKEFDLIIDSSWAFIIKGNSTQVTSDIIQEGSCQGFQKNQATYPIDLEFPFNSAYPFNLEILFDWACPFKDFVGIPFKDFVGIPFKDFVRNLFKDQESLDCSIDPFMAFINSFEEILNQGCYFEETLKLIII